MRRLAIALLASAALMSPALAANSGMHRRMSRRSDAQGMVSPRTLGRSGVRRLQIALNKKGFDAGRVDGVWGPSTRKALMSFERHARMRPNGELNRRVLADLGLSSSKYASRRNLTTGRSSSEDNNTRSGGSHPSNNGTMQPGQSSGANSQNMQPGKPTSPNAAH